MDLLSAPVLPAVHDDSTTLNYQRRTHGKGGTAGRGERGEGRGDRRGWGRWRGEQGKDLRRFIGVDCRWQKYDG